MLGGDALRWSLVLTRLGWWISVSILAALSTGSPAAAADSFEGQPIASVTFEPERQPLTASQLLAMIPLHVGQPLRGADLRDSIQRLYQTGEYADIAVDAEPAGAGVALKFITKPAFFIGYVAVDGVPEPPNEGQLLVATKLTLGAAYEPDETAAATARIVDLLKRNGFYNAGIEPAVATREATQQVHINFHVDPRKRAKFDGLVVSGNTLRSDEGIVNSSGWKRFRGWLGWHQLTDTRLQSGLDNIRSWYPKHDHLLARVTLADLDYHSASNTVTPNLNIDSGPPVLVRLRGAKLSSGQLRSLLPIYEERTIDRDLLEEGSRDLASYFQGQGYFDAIADYQTDRLSRGSGRTPCDRQGGTARQSLFRQRHHSRAHERDAGYADSLPARPLQPQ
jgi:outer membrane protein assembly factor BamA